MKLIISLLLGVLCCFFSALSYSKTNCNKDWLAKNPHDILPCYIALSEDAKPLWAIDMDEHNKRGISIETYKLTSQEWPKPAMSDHTNIWKHRLVIYRPDVIKSHQALLLVDGGTAVRYNKDDPNPVKIDFARIALTTHTVVVDLQDIPEQYLTMEKDVILKEDGLVAYSWAKFLDNPQRAPYWPLQLPMTKSIVRAMDATQQIIQQEDNFHITHFVISGASKRGWAAWLAALSDNRVNAIVPIAINVLNMKKMLDATYSSYDNHWPQAFHDYEAEHIPEKMNSRGFEELTNIIDPLSYLNSKSYKSRFNIPKYIINASGDDFFIPDSLNLYLHDLPGENAVRMLPNQNHYISDKIIENALLSYYETIIYQIPRPQLRWKVDKSGVLQSVSANAVPANAILWEAENAMGRDFRLAKQITYHSKKLIPACNNNHCEYALNITPPKKGWKSDFVELTYQFSNGDHFVLTTPAYVITTPDTTVAAAAPTITPKKLTAEKITGRTAMQGPKETLSQLVDVIALSKKKCTHPIRAHLAYATKNNFVGSIIDGYTPGLTDVALMSKDAAEALCKVQNDLIQHHHLELLIYDSYRPKQAVAHFVRWSKQPVPNNAEGKHELARKKLHYPDIEKASMFELGYVSADSQHCYGHTVDLVLVDMNGKELNHGVRFDYMGTLSHDTASVNDIGAEALKNRLLLSKVMKKYGFVPYPKEYWHFSYENKTIHKPIDIKITPELKGLNA